MKYPRNQFFLPRVICSFILAAILLTVAVNPLVAATTPVPRILILNSYNIGYDWWEEEMKGLQDVLSKSYPRTETFIEHLDTKKFSTKKHFPRMADLLESKYSHQHLDVMVAMDNAALEFALQYRQRISPGTPLIFCGINDYDPAMIAGQSKITGVAEYHDVVGTLDLALQLHPNIRNIVVIHDFTDTGRAIRRELEKTATRYSTTTLQFMEEMPLEATVKKLQDLTSDNVVLLLSYTVEKGGRTFSHSEAARLVSRASPVPVYSVYAAQLGNGVVGGRMMKGEIQGNKTAGLIRQILEGQDPDSLPVITGNLSHPMFDYLILKKYNISTAKLPADRVIINNPSSTFAINKATVWMGSLFTLVSTVGLIGLLLNIRKRKYLEEMLRLKIDAYQESQQELLATEEMLRAQVDDYVESQDELQSTEEMLREQIEECHLTYDQLLATEEMLRVQLEFAEESSQKFKAVFDHSPIMVALTTLPEGTFTEVNQSFIDMFGYSRSEVIGKTTVELGVWRRENDRNHYLQQLQSNGFVHNFEAEMHRKDGTVFPVLFSGMVLEIAGKACVLSTVLEITEQKRLQNQLLQSQKMDVVGQLAGGVAHDFNNMLAGIMAAAEMLKRRLKDDERNIKMVDTIIEAATRSADLTRELLTFSHKGTSVSRPVSIHDTIASVLSLLERTIDKRVQLISRLDVNNPFVMGDQAQLQNALLNLGVNARDAMPHGGTLTYATAVKELDESDCRSIGLSIEPGRYVEIEVADSGIGMTKEVMEHIFEPFYTTKSVGKGTGLGLAAVYGTVRNHTGEINVQSNPGYGTKFKIYLPVLEGEAFLPVDTGVAIDGKGVILLVDDEEILRTIGCDMLEDLGYTVYLAEDGARALELFALHKSEISMVMLDMIMPKMGGKEVFLRLREQEPELKVLFCSGFNREGTADELVTLGAGGFIQKPYSRSELSRAVADVLNATNVSTHL
ncbi:MAG: response regulator [Desulfuromonadaceae bacterium]|nr:response regulator [Desulfuromonadaceae bacterium]